MKLAVFGNYGVRNLGDDLILMGLREKYPQDTLTVFCGNPEQVRNQFGLESSHFFPGGLRTWRQYFFSAEARKRSEESLRALKQMDQIIIGGGGILVDRHIKAVVLWWFQLRTIKKSGIPYSFIGNSLELKSWWSRWLFKPFLKSARWISVRDQASHKLLNSMDIASELVDDLSSWAPLDLEPRKTQKLLAVALCRWGIGERQASVLRQFMQQKQQEGFQIIGLAFQTVGDDDRQVLKELFPSVEITSELPDVLEVLRTCEALIAMRYHAVLLGLRFHIPTIALSYQEKVANLMSDRGLSDLCIPIQKIDGQSVQQLFLKAVEGGYK
ncbi:MAG: polysaccharide pyruvyl transferase family protein [Candidatus Altimarinota bacterium]